jgi:multisubunit Na+/H+ antiporter MnhB subunit
MLPFAELWAQVFVLLVCAVTVIVIVLLTVKDQLSFRRLITILKYLSYSVVTATVSLFLYSAMFAKGIYWDWLLGQMIMASSCAFSAWMMNKILQVAPKNA